MHKGKDIIISSYSSKTSKTNNDIFLFDELKRIKYGFVKEQIDYCRKLLAQGLVAEYKSAKANLPGVTFSGKFNGVHKSDHLLNYSQLMIVDFDSLDITHLKKKKEELSADDYVLSVWYSPSNHGLKVLIKTDATADIHKIYFGEICNYLLEKYGIEADKSGSDTCRICFTSYDPDIVIKEDCLSFSIDLAVAESKLTLIRPERQSMIKVTDVKLEKVLFYATEGKNLKRDRATIDKIIKFLRVRKLSITNSYQNWYRVGLAIANTFTYDIGKKYYMHLCELDGANHDEYKSINILGYCYRNRKIKGINFSTIVYLAEQQGFVNKLKNIK